MGLKYRLKLIVGLYPFWSLFKIYSKYIDFLFQHKNLLRQSLINNAENHLSIFFGDKVVLAGPFKGLRYPEFISFGSVIYAKLAGTYENAISHFFSKEHLDKYDHVIDIGCAEGYYAVGVCYVDRNIRVTAIDVSDQAIQLCKQLADHNKVGERITTENHFNWKLVRSIVERGAKRILVICDCEGCELEIFKQLDPIIEHCDLIIELHDFIERGITERLVNNFEKTHQVQIIDEAKPKKIDQLRGLNQFERELVMDEQRPILMKWMILTKKQK